jgi:hypothetical protein
MEISYRGKDHSFSLALRLVLLAVAIYLLLLIPINLNTSNHEVSITAFTGVYALIAILAIIITAATYRKIDTSIASSGITSLQFEQDFFIPLNEMSSFKVKKVFLWSFILGVAYLQIYPKKDKDYHTRGEVIINPSLNTKYSAFISTKDIATIKHFLLKHKVVDSEPKKTTASLNGVTLYTVIFQSISLVLLILAILEMRLFSTKFIFLLFLLALFILILLYCISGFFYRKIVSFSPLYFIFYRQPKIIEGRLAVFKALMVVLLLIVLVFIAALIFAKNIFG